MPGIHRQRGEDAEDAIVEYRGQCRTVLLAQLAPMKNTDAGA